jgi:hypothetical protein
MMVATESLEKDSRKVFVLKTLCFPVLFVSIEANIQGGL